MEFFPGFQFQPTDEVLINYYLKPTVLNQQIPYNKMIHHANIYASQPSSLADSYEGFERENVKEWYFFSPRVCKNGIRATRKAHLGYWRMSQSAKPIQHNGVDIGLKNVLNFYIRDNKNSIKTEWIMHEYIIIDNNDDSNNNKKNDFALCKIYKNPKKYKNNKDVERPQQQLQSVLLSEAQNQQEELQTNVTTSTDEQQQHNHQQPQSQLQSQPFIYNDYYPQPQLMQQGDQSTYEEVLSHNSQYQPHTSTDEQQQYNHHQQPQPQLQSQPFIYNDYYPQPQFMQQGDQSTYDELCSYNNSYHQPQSQLLIQQSDQSKNEELLWHNSYYQPQLQQQQQPQTQSSIQQSDEESSNGQYQPQQQQQFIQEGDQSTNEDQSLLYNGYDPISLFSTGQYLT
ncbi:hypothetical protein CsatA_005863 [Cannabis sativa]